MGLRKLGSILLLCAAAGLPAAEPDSAPALAHSALLRIDGAESENTLTLRVQRTADRSPVVADDLSVALDGKTLPVSPRGNGVYVVDLKGLHAGSAALDITVPHDGIREVLHGTLTAPGSSAGGGLLGAHSQMAWWILNVAVVLIAAIVLSRRKPS